MTYHFGVYSHFYTDHNGFANLRPAANCFSAVRGTYICEMGDTIQLTGKSYAHHLIGDIEDAKRCRHNSRYTKNDLVRVLFVGNVGVRCKRVRIDTRVAHANIWSCKVSDNFHRPIVAENDGVGVRIWTEYARPRWERIVHNCIPPALQYEG